MAQHYVLTINPEAKYEWEQCVLRNPISGKSPDLNEIIAQEVNQQPGSYLISVKIEVEVLEQAPLSSTNKTTVELSREKHLRQYKAS